MRHRRAGGVVDCPLEWRWQSPFRDDCISPFGGPSCMVFLDGSM